ncbi:GspE/PulE family protein [Parasynechococcus sp.]|uniref:GspE/PulE family protein n=1 Tax=Parasynechococcus sp. TaxID=3101203 RepID=UPI003703ABDF
MNAESFLHDFNPDGVLESDEDDDAQLARDAIDLEASLKDAEASPVVTLVDRILLQAMSMQASDIHVEPQQKGLRLRFRQDGVLQQYIEPLLSRLVPAVTSRFKILADLDIAEHRQAQDGRIRRKYRDRSTTLHSLLAERNDPGINISTVEDPIEYTLPGITQCPVNREKGFDFATALRAFMRQEPDVLLVGETRDLETAKTAIEAALTGHLVLSTLHANDAPSTIARLDEMGVEPFMVSASMVGIIS